ncbi:MAG: hypothetical protein ACI4SF_14350 [Oscillospiraceae bacterium]
MKDILKIMRFDYFTAKPIAFGGMIFTILLFGSLGLLFSPIICSYISIIAVILVMPLQKTADKSGFNKLYGILPVDRKNITRGRFLYIFMVFFSFEVLELVLVAIANTLKLYRIFPNQNSELIQMAKDSFANTQFTMLMVFVMFAIFCLFTSYMEMMGQIHGRESDFKTIVITIGVISVIAFAFVFLSEHDMLPLIKLPSLPESVGGMLLIGAVLDLLMLAICMLFGEITARKLVKREL